MKSCGLPTAPFLIARCSNHEEICSIPEEICSIPSSQWMVLPCVTCAILTTDYLTALKHARNNSTSDRHCTRQCVWWLQHEKVSLFPYISTNMSAATTCLRSVVIFRQPRSWSAPLHPKPILLQTDHNSSPYAPFTEQRRQGQLQVPPHKRCHCRSPIGCLLCPLCQPCSHTIAQSQRHARR